MGHFAMLTPHEQLSRNLHIGQWTFYQWFVELSVDRWTTWTPLRITVTMWPYTCILVIFDSTPAMFFCDATMYIYDDSTALEPHFCWMWD